MIEIPEPATPTYCPTCRGLNANPIETVLCFWNGNLVWGGKPELIYESDVRKLSWIPDKDMQVNLTIGVPRVGAPTVSSINDRTHNAGKPVTWAITPIATLCLSCGGEGTATSAMRRKMAGLW